MVPIRESIDEVELKRALGQERAVINKSPNLLFLNPACFGDAVYELAKLGVHDALHGLFMRWRIGTFGVQIHRIFVFPAMAETRLQPDFFKHALIECAFKNKTGQADPSRWLEINLIKRGG